MGGALRRRAAFFHDDAVAPARKVVSESRERTFDVDIVDHAELAAILERMAGELCASLAKHDRRGRTIAIKVRLDNFATITRARTIEEPTREPTRVRAVALELLRKYAPPRPVRLLGVRVAGLESGEGRSHAPSHAPSSVPMRPTSSRSPSRSYRLGRWR